LDKFLNRHSFRTRKPTTTAQKPPVEYEQKLVDFILYLKQLREKNNYQYIYAADETAVSLNALGGLCIDEKGSKDVSFTFKFLKIFLGLRFNDWSRKVECNCNAYWSL